MKCLLSAAVLFLVALNARADDFQGPRLGTPSTAPMPLPAETPPSTPSAIDNQPIPQSSYRIVPGGMVAGRRFGNHFSTVPGGPVLEPAGPVFEWYHAESTYPSADLPVYPTPYNNTGIYGPMMIDLLLFPGRRSQY